MKLREFLKSIPFVAASTPAAVCYAKGIKLRQIDALVPKNNPEYFSVVFCVDFNMEPFGGLSYIVQRINELGYETSNISTDDVMTDDNGVEFRNDRKNKVKVTFRKITPTT